MEFNSSELGYLYRYEDHMYAHFDEWGDGTGSSTLKVELRKFPILKKTPKGAWIDVWGERRFVRQTARKQYALPTQEEAKESFIARKLRQASIYRARLDRAQLAIYKMDKL